MTQSRTTAWFWFLGGAALIVAGLLSGGHRRYLDMAAGVLFFIVAVTWLLRGNSGSRPR